MCVSGFVTLEYFDTTGYATESQAISEWPNRKTSNREAQVGHGVQRIPRLYGQLHERTGVTIITNFANTPYGIYNELFFWYADCQYRGIYRWTTSWESRRSFN